MEELEIICKIVRDETFRYSSDDMGPVEFRRFVLKAIAELASRIDEVQQKINAEVIEISDIQSSDTLTTD